MRSNNRHIGKQNDLKTILTRLDKQCNRTMKETIDKEEKSPRFAFLKISANTHCTHLQSRTGQPTIQALQKSAILPTLKRKTGKLKSLWH